MPRPYALARIVVRKISRWLQIDRSSAIFAAHTACTAWLAFALASLFHVENAYWAAMAAWIVMQPTRGMLLERGFYRLLGTLAGALAGFAILYCVRSPYWAVGALGLWAAACAGFAHLFRRVRSYGATLAGITAVVVVMSTVHGTEPTWQIAYARVLCTIIGVCVASLSGMLWVPHSPQPAFLARLRAMAGDAVDFVGKTLSQRPGTQGYQRARALLGEMSDLEQALLVNTAGMRNGAHRSHQLNAFIGCALEVMAAGQALQARLADRADAAVVAALDAIASALRQPAADPAARQQQSDALSTIECCDVRLALALRELLAAEADILDTQSALDTPRFRHAPLKPDYDWPTVSLAACSTALAICLAGWAALASGWVYAPLAALGVGNFVMILSGQDRPQLIAFKIFQGVCAGVLAATLFRIFVLPLAHSTGVVLLLVIPFMALGGVARASRRTAMPAVDYNMCFMLAGQPFLPAQTALSPILQASAALVIAIALVSTGYLLLPRDPGRRVRSIARLIVRDLERLADLATAPGDAWRAHMSHRLLRLTVHLGRIENLRGNRAEDVLGAMNLACAIVELRAALASASPDADALAAANAVLTALRALSTAPAALPAALDAALAQLSHRAASSEALHTALRQTQAAVRQGAHLLLQS